MEAPAIRPAAVAPTTSPGDPGLTPPIRGVRSSRATPANEDRPEPSTDPFEALAKAFAKALPGVGFKTGMRYARHLLAGPHRANLLRETLARSQERTCTCSQCGNLAFQDPCWICTSPRRDASLILVVKNIEALQSIETCGVFNGRYQVLGDVPTTIDGVGDRTLPLFRIGNACSEPEVREVVMALDDTPEAAATEAMIADKIKRPGLQISRLARGMPLGADVDKLDDGTITMAVARRTPFHSD